MGDDDVRVRTRRTATVPQVFDAVASFGPISQQEIVSLISRTGGAVERALRDLRDSEHVVDGLVEDLLQRHPGGHLALPPRSALSGRLHTNRRLRLFSLSKSAGSAVGVVVNHDSVQVGVSDGTGGLLEVLSEVRDVDGSIIDLVLRDAVEMIATLVGHHEVRADQLRGICLAIAAAVNDEAGTVAGEILKSWSAQSIERRFRTSLRRALPAYAETRVILENVANAEALGQRRFGMGRGTGDFILVRLGQGVGLGIISGGHVLRGATGGAGELGHIAVRTGHVIRTDPSIGIAELDPEASCRCGGYGHVEAYASYGAVVARARPTLTLELTNDEAGIAAIIAAAEAGNIACAKVIDDVGAVIGAAVVTAVDILDPDIVLLSGPIASGICDAVADHLRRSRRPVERQPPPVHVVDEPERLVAAARGAVATVMSQTKPLSWSMAVAAGFAHGEDHPPA